MDAMPTPKGKPGRKPKVKPSGPMNPEQLRTLQFAELVKSLRKPPGKTPPVTHCNSATKGKYKGEGNAVAPLRPQADAATRIPSRMGNHLHHANGRVTTLSGKPIAHQGAPA